MRSIKFFTIFALLIVMCLPSIASAAQSEWMTYADARYGFSIDYPSSWKIEPRDDQPGIYGAVLTFSSPLTDIKPNSSKVVIGLYTVERKNGKSLTQWSSHYQRLSSSFSASQIKIEEATSIHSATTDNQEAFRIRGISPLTKFQVTNMPRGQTVWFI
jgi:hypothetical protein